MRGVVPIPPPFAINNSDTDLDFSGKDKLETVPALKEEGEDGVGRCNFNSLIEVTPPMFSPVFQQASCCRREACPYVPPAASDTPEIHSPPYPASMSEPPSALALSALARPPPDPVFVNTPPLVYSVLVSPVTAPASV